MASFPTVVRNRSNLSKPEIHSLLMAGWARAIRNHGKGAFADRLEISTTGLDKQLTGSMPAFDVIDKALDAEETILDDYLTRKGKRLVDKDAVCDTDNLGMLLAQLHVWLEKARHPDSPGGAKIVHTEMLEGEMLLRSTYTEIGRFLEECASLRRAA